MRLYHYTCLMNLPAILRDGIIYGEFPLAVGVTKLGWPSFTSEPFCLEAAWTGDGRLDKTRVRLTVDVPDQFLKCHRDLWQELKVEKWFQELMVPNGDGRNWFVSLQPVPRSVILEVAIRNWCEYVCPKREDLLDLIRDIVTERQKLNFWLDDYEVVQCEAKNGWSWLFDNMDCSERPVDSIFNDESILSKELRRQLFV